MEKLYLSLPLFIRSGISHIIKPLPYFKGKHTLEKYGKDKLNEIAKLNFKNTERILRTCIF